MHTAVLLYGDLYNNTSMHKAACMYTGILRFTKYSLKLQDSTTLNEISFAMRIDDIKLNNNRSVAKQKKPVGTKTLTLTITNMISTMLIN